MIKFPAQFHSYRKTTMGESLITFSVDRACSKDTMDLVGKEIGTQFILHLEDITQDTSLHKDPDELNNRFVRKLHFLLSEYAEQSGMKPEEAKNQLKETLKDKKLIEKSTTELDIKGLAIACNIVDDWIQKNGSIQQQ